MRYQISNGNKTYTVQCDMNPKVEGEYINFYNLGERWYDFDVLVGSFDRKIFNYVLACKEKGEG